MRLGCSKGHLANRFRRQLLRYSHPNGVRYLGHFIPVMREAVPARHDTKQRLSMGRERSAPVLREELVLLVLEGQSSASLARDFKTFVATIPKWIGARRVRRLMGEASLWGVPVRKRRHRRTRMTDGGVPDLVQRDFAAAQPNTVWVSDLTEIRTTEGKLHLCIIKICDPSSRIASGRLTYPAFATSLLIFTSFRRTTLN